MRSNNIERAVEEAEESLKVSLLKEQNLMINDL